MQVTVPKPDIKGRTEIINWYLKKIKVDSGVSFFSNVLLCETKPTAVFMPWFDGPDSTHWQSTAGVFLLLFFLT